MLARLDPQRKIAVGAAIAALAGAAMSVAPHTGWTTLERPWSFLAGFLFGLLAGVGAMTAVVGLLGCRRERAS